MVDVFGFNEWNNVNGLIFSAMVGTGFGIVFGSVWKVIFSTIKGKWGKLL